MCGSGNIGLTWQGRKVEIFFNYFFVNVLNNFFLIQCKWYIFDGILFYHNAYDDYFLWNGVKKLWVAGSTNIYCLALVARHCKQ